MSPEALRRLLGDVAAGRKSPEAALAELRRLPFSDLGFARVDAHRELRTGIPEVIYGGEKTAEQIVAIAREIVAARQNLLVTRLSPDKAERLQQAIPGVRYNPTARLAVRKHRA
ncbi:MAG: 1-(5-phosphoribosyl)-5-amino-4-imidazole-carboxylate carboxylase, partial [Candidatus Dadabacteria bacterium]